MLLAEEKARQQWCPVAMVGMNRAMPAKGGGKECTRCIASNCMAWRWGDGEFSDEPPHVRRPLKDRRRGYCGLAGKVE